MTDASIDVTGRDTFARETINQGHLEALEVTMNALAAVESVPAASQSKKKKRNGSHADTATGQHETAEVVVITDEPETVTITPGFSTATTTSPEVVHYESTPDLPTVELSPDERARIEAEIGRIFQSLDKNPYDAAAWDSLGNQYKALGQFDDAIGAYQEAVTLDQSNAGYHHDLGLVYAAVGKPDEAIASFEIVIEIEPDHSLAHATLGGYYRRNGKEELAKAHIEKARRLIEKEENPYNLACLEAIDSNIDRSLELLEIALKNKREYVNWARTDHDLDFIRTDPRFLALLTKYSTQTGK
jgi:tetratricopeptide (TPR) repeat protein